MADIQTYLDNIQNAVYGKDVRSAIYAAIQAINNDTQNFVQGSLDTALTSTSLPAQGKAVGDKIAYEDWRIDQVVARIGSTDAEGTIYNQIQGIYDVNADQETRIAAINADMSNYPDTVITSAEINTIINGLN